MQGTLFILENEYSRKWYNFKNSTDLGRIYNTIPWAELTILLPEKKSPKGAPAWLKPQGYFGMMFLKHFTGLSDEKLLERFHTDYAMQLFCGVLLKENEKIKNNSFVTHIRGYLGQQLGVDFFQKEMISYWKTAGDLENTHQLMLDATCFESYIRYPTDVKLLWECIEKIHTKFIPILCEKQKIKLPKTVFKDKRSKYLGYSKSKKRGHRKTKQIRQKLLNFLDKSLELYKKLADEHPNFEMETKHIKLMATIKIVLEQQKTLILDSKNTVEDRIVSIFKPYIRPIKRGKENKSTEFGMKAHIAQVDGINQLEHHSYSSFNECNRLKDSVLSHENMFKCCTELAADNIYPTNNNRTFITEKGIQTNFPKKGKKESDPKKAKAEKATRERLGKSRSTVLEGSFGNEKNHYMLRKIRATKPETELIWVLFGMYTANCVAISNKREAKKEKEKREKEDKIYRYNKRKAA